VPPQPNKTPEPLAAQGFFLFLFRAVPICPVNGSRERRGHD
jgi:hypothetical protein